MNRLVTFLAVTTLLFSCSEPKKYELVGLYEFRDRQSSEIVIIYESGKYQNSAFINNKMAWRDYGLWKMETQDGVEGVTFENFRFGVPGRSSLKGYWFVVPDRDFFGGSRLCFDLDLGRCFDRRGAGRGL